MLSEKIAHGFNTAAQDLNPGTLSLESETLLLSHCALRIQNIMDAGKCIYC